MQGHQDNVHPGPDDESRALALKLAQASLGLLEGYGGAVSLVFDPSQLLALVAILIGSLRGFVFPLRAAVSDFGQLAHQALSGQDRPPQVTGDHLGKLNMVQEDRALRGVMHLQSERGEQPRDECQRDKETG